MPSQLEPLGPQEGLDWYIADQENEKADATVRSHRSRLSYFVDWCSQEDITNLNTLSGRDIQRYKTWRRGEGDLSKVSLKTQLDTLRVFLRWCENVDAVQQDLSTKVQSPQLQPGDNVADSVVESEEAEAILEHLGRYEYCSLQHVTISLLWNCMLRRGSVRSLDIEDYNRDEQYLETTHRPETDTPLKNRQSGERLMALSDEMCALLNEWIDKRRPDTTDEYGRKPLLATKQGRIHKMTIASYCYQWTRPCFYSEGCPHDRDPDECAATSYDNPYDCPSSVSVHAFRRGSITHWLSQDVPPRVVSDRADVSEGVIDKHYDKRSEREKMEQRRDYLDNI